MKPDNYFEKTFPHIRQLAKISHVVVNIEKLDMNDD